MVRDKSTDIIVYWIDCINPNILFWINSSQKLNYCNQQWIVFWFVNIDLCGDLNHDQYEILQLIFYFEYTNFSAPRRMVVSKETPSDECVDSMLNSMLLSRFQPSSTQRQTSAAEPATKRNNQQPKLCLVPVPYLIPVPIPLTPEFIFRHYSPLGARAILRC